MSAPPRALVGGAVAASVLAISTAAILVRLSDAPPLAVAFHRLAYATLLLLPFAAWRARAELRALSARDLGALALVGVVLAVHFAAWISSLSLTSVASSVFLVTLHPVFVAVLSARLFGEGIGARGFLGVGLALVGGVVITWGDAGAGANPLLGDALALLGAAAAAAYFLAGRGFRRRLSLLAYVVPVYAASSVALLAMLALLPAPYGGAVLGYPPREHLLFLALAVVPMLLGHTVLNWALKYVTAPVIATTILGEPLGASVLALFVLREAPSWTTLAGGGLVLAGIALVALTGAAAAPTPRGAPPPGPTPEEAGSGPAPGASAPAGSHPPPPPR